MANNDDSTPAASSDENSTGGDNLAGLSADPGHLFDQTNGLADGLQGDDDDAPDDDGTLTDPTLSDEETRQRPDEDGRLV